jgi:hypothetical protein
MCTGPKACATHRTNLDATLVADTPPACTWAEHLRKADEKDFGAMMQRHENTGRPKKTMGTGKWYDVSRFPEQLARPRFDKDK